MFNNSVRRKIQIIIEMSNKAFNKSIEGMKKRFASFSSFITKHAKTIAVGLVGSLGAFIVLATKTAARTQVLNRVLGVVGSTAGYASSELSKVKETIRGLGISEQEAISLQTKFMQSQLDLADASKIARVAQDLAVVAGQNSSDAAITLTNAIVMQRPVLLKQYGIVESLISVYGKMADSLGKSRQELTESEKKQAFLNTILKAGEKVAGVYTAAMKDVGKRMTSIPRHFQDASNAIGQYFLPAMGFAVDGLTSFLKTLTEVFGKDKIAIPIDKATTKFQVLGDKIKILTTNLDEGKISLNTYIKEVKAIEGNLDTVISDSVQTIIESITANTKDADLGASQLFEAWRVGKIPTSAYDEAQQELSDWYTFYDKERIRLVKKGIKQVGNIMDNMDLFNIKSTIDGLVDFGNKLKVAVIQKSKETDIASVLFSRWDLDIETMVKQLIKGIKLPIGQQFLPDDLERWAKFLGVSTADMLEKDFVVKIGKKVEDIQKFFKFMKFDTTAFDKQISETEKALESTGATKTEKRDADLKARLGAIGLSDSQLKAGAKSSEAILTEIMRSRQSIARDYYETSKQNLNEHELEMLLLQYDYNQEQLDLKQQLSDGKIGIIDFMSAYELLKLKLTEEQRLAILKKSNKDELKEEQKKANLSIKTQEYAGNFVDSMQNSLVNKQLSVERAAGIASIEMLRDLINSRIATRAKEWALLAASSALSGNFGKAAGYTALVVAAKVAQHVVTGFAQSAIDKLDKTSEAAIDAVSADSEAEAAAGARSSSGISTRAINNLYISPSITITSAGGTQIVGDTGLTEAGETIKNIAVAGVKEAIETGEISLGVV